jgi:hypothetical protein
MTDASRPPGLAPVGFTKDVGWELGVRRTVARPLPVVWDHLLGAGLPRWLGAEEVGVVGSSYVTADGTTGTVRSRTDGLRLRLTWRPAGWTHDSTLQLTLRSAPTGTTIAVHQDRLVGAEEREQLLAHWTEVVEALVREGRPAVLSSRRSAR